MEQRPLAEFLFSHLAELSVRHVFGIPGDYILPLYRTLESTPGIAPVVATHEPCAAFSADAYGRQAGLGVLLVTYGVGGFNALNGVAGAYAEQSPLLVISGGPPRGYTTDGDPLHVLLHHVVKTETDQLDTYRRVTELAIRLDDPATAALQIRRAARHARESQRPVYLEIPTDLMQTPIPVDAPEPTPHTGDRSDLERAVVFFQERLAKAANPVLLVGVEVARHRLQGEVRRLMAAHGAPVATTLLAKSTLPETEPGVLGVYAGVLSTTPEVRRHVEDADLVVMLGNIVTDVGCGAFTADLHRDRLLIAKTGWIGDGSLRIGRELSFPRFLRALAAAASPSDQAPPWPTATRFDYHGSDSVMDRYLGVLEDQLTSSDVVVADTGDSCCGSAHLRTQRENGYVAPAFYGTMGFAVPAALGVQLADPDARPLVLVGDGAFQMTGLELSNAVRHNLDPIVLLFNNDGFGMQRVFQDGGFNDIGRWDYQRIPALLGGGRAWRADSPEQLRSALAEARAHRAGPSLIEVSVPRGVISTGLQVLGKAFRREKQGACPLGSSDADTSACAHHERCAYCRAAIWR
ncbi:MAG: thiamine pyrophosphate-dependent enzyme [bacterium]